MYMHKIAVETNNIPESINSDLEIRIFFKKVNLLLVDQSFPAM